MVKKVLPPLNEQNQVPNIAGSGEWKSEDATFLEKLAKGLKMSGEEVVSAADINSVPDVWARVLIVRNGLLDNSKSIVDEWRGTLALLALAPYYKHIYGLSSNIVNIQDIKNNPYTNAGSPDTNYAHIGKILFDVKPQDTMAQGQDWNAIGVLTFNKKEISERIISICDYLNLEKSFDSFVKWIIDLRKELNIPHKLSEVVDEEKIDLDKLSKMAFEDPSTSGNPKKLSKADMKVMYEHSISGELF